MKYILVILLFILTFIGCKPEDNDIGLLKIINRSNYSITILYSDLYPDTAYVHGKAYDVCHIQLPDTTYNAYDKNWRGRFGNNSQQTLIFFVYDSVAEFTNPRQRIVVDVDSIERADWKLYIN